MNFGPSLDRSSSQRSGGCALKHCCINCLAVRITGPASMRGSYTEDRTPSSLRGVGWKFSVTDLKRSNVNLSDLGFQQYPNCVRFSDMQRRRIGSVVNGARISSGKAETTSEEEEANFRMEKP